MRKETYQNLRLLSMLLFLLAGCVELSASELPTKGLEPVTLKLNWQHGTQFLGFYVAQSRGYYAAEGLTVTIEPLQDSNGMGAVTEGVATGEFDFGVGGGELLRAQAQSVPVTAIANIYKYGPEAFFARADCGIVTPADLAGRRVVVKGDTWEELLVKLLESEGLTLADVEPVPGGFNMTPFFEEDVDVWAGYLTNEVIRARRQGLEVVTLPLYEYGIYNHPSTIYTRRAALEADPDLSVRFLRASLRGWEWAFENPTKSVDIMLELFPEMAAERDFHLASFDASLPLIRPPGVRIGEIDCAAWEGHETLAGLESTEGLCTTTIVEAAWENR